MKLDELAAQRGGGFEPEPQARETAAELAAKEAAREADIQAELASNRETATLKGELLTALKGRTVYPREALTLALKLAGVAMQDSDWTTEALTLAAAAYGQDTEGRRAAEAEARATIRKCLKERAAQDKNATKYLDKLATGYRASLEQVESLKRSILAAAPSTAEGYLFGDPQEGKEEPGAAGQ